MSYPTNNNQAAWVGLGCFVFALLLFCTLLILNSPPNTNDLFSIPSQIARQKTSPSLPELWHSLERIETVYQDSDKEPELTKAYENANTLITSRLLQRFFAPSLPDDEAIQFLTLALDLEYDHELERLPFINTDAERYMFADKVKRLMQTTTSKETAEKLQQISMTLYMAGYENYALTAIRAKELMEQPE